VEAHEGPVGRELVGLERALGMVADRECDSVRAQQRVDRLGEPAPMAELERVAAGRQRLERRGQPVVVTVEVLGELPEDRAHLGRGGERLDALVELLDAGVEGGEPLDVRDVAAHLQREAEVRRGLLHPAGDGVA
jgi:hypothetical protein